MVVYAFLALIVAQNAWQLYKLKRFTMATFDEVRAAYKAYAEGLKAALVDAQARAQKAADDLAAFQADDAATDATQLAEAAQANADALQADLDSLQAPAEEPVEEPPVEDVPVQ